MKKGEREKWPGMPYKETAPAGRLCTRCSRPLNRVRLRLGEETYQWFECSCCPYADATWTILVPAEAWPSSLAGGATAT